MKDRLLFLVKYLLLPLGGLFIILLFLENKYSNVPFYGNLATEFLGIIITVFYVDFVFQRQHKIFWRQATDEVNKSIQIFAEDSIQSIKESAQIYYREMWQAELPYFRYMEPKRRYFETILILLVENIFEKIPKLSNDNWNHVFISLQNIDKECVSIVNLCDQRLSPEQYSLFIMIRTSIKLIIDDNTKSNGVFQIKVDLGKDELIKRDLILSSASREIYSIISNLRQLGLSTFKI